MSAGLTIRTDGMEWPLATFIDAYSFTRTDGERPDFAGLAGELDVVTANGELRKGVEMSAVPWWETIAVAVPKGSMRLAPCHGCGESIVPVSVSTDGDGRTVLTTDICDHCEEDCW